MMKACSRLLILFLPLFALAQKETELEQAMRRFMADEQIRYGQAGLVVKELQTSKVLIDWNGSIGLAPASTQKIFTAAAALDQLGTGFQYSTALLYNGKVQNGVLSGDLIIQGAGDPSFGSWRYAQTREQQNLSAWTDALRTAGIKEVRGQIKVNQNGFSQQPLPGGWIWDDMGNYYGAGSWGINWRENQFDLIMVPGDKAGDSLKAWRMEPMIPYLQFQNRITTGKPGSGDNGYIYSPPYATHGFAEGTIPAGVNSFTIAGAMPNPFTVLAQTLERNLQAAGIAFNNNTTTSAKQDGVLLHAYASPNMDSLVYWFMQKSINLYGEALLKTLAQQKNGIGSTDAGVQWMRKYWQERGIDPNALRMVDGSGLSPLNRNTAYAQIAALEFASRQNWFAAYLQSFPINNQMQLKSGTIQGAKAYSGYYTNASGKTYLISFLVNNYNGSASAITRKMFAVLDVLK